MSLTSEQVRGNGQPCETVRIVAGDSFTIINAHEFVDGQHELYYDATDAPATSPAATDSTATDSTATDSTATDSTGNETKKRSKK